jgi:D-aminopeptidase
MMDGVHIGRLLGPAATQAPERGSIMIVVATDAPLLDRGLRRIAKRAGIGLARTGSMVGNSSGDIVIAFSAAPGVRIPHTAAAPTISLQVVAEGPIAGGRPVIDALFEATAEATEEAILNALCMATTVVGRDDNTSHALPLDQVAELLRAAGRIARE